MDFTNEKIFKFPLISIRYYKYTNVRGRTLTRLFVNKLQVL